MLNSEKKMCELNLAISLSILDILAYVEGTSRSRCIEEAEEILKSRHLITCGVKTFSADKGAVNVLGLCLQSSAINAFPHTIEGELLFESNKIKIGSFKCSCKGGAAGFCKHCVSVLIYCNRNTIRDLEKLSVTDVKCLWAEKKQTTQSWYETVPLQDFCCASTSSNTYIDMPTEEAAKTREKFMALFPSSALSKHSKRRRLDFSSRQIREETKTEVELEEVLKIMFEKDLFLSLTAPELLPHCLAFYKENVEVSMNRALDIAAVSQKTSEWRNYRKLRITASKCYELFTYTKNKNPNWEKKILGYVNSSFHGNSSTTYGVETEAEAIDAYESLTKQKVQIVGLIVNPNVPWLGCSPDGLVMDNGELHVLEIKCPVNGITVSATELIKQLNYILLNKAGSFMLKHNHKYYGQVQLLLYLTGCTKCIFVIYASFDKTFVKIDVQRDEKFMKIFIPSLHYVYFKKMLPILCSTT